MVRERKKTLKKGWGSLKRKKKEKLSMGQFGPMSHL